jgi:hypothetical protein
MAAPGENPMAAVSADRRGVRSRRTASWSCCGIATSSPGDEWAFSSLPLLPPKRERLDDAAQYQSFQSRRTIWLVRELGRCLRVASSPQGERAKTDATYALTEEV